VKSDRKTHFRALRDTILDWQAGGLTGARENWAGFAARVAAARDFATDTPARRVLVVSSGGPIGHLVASALQAPVAQMIELNLQVRNTSFTRFIFSGGRFGLAEFNATPHFASRETAQFLSYS
jgi:broad specificity phosphatase PhoE